MAVESSLPAFLSVLTTSIISAVAAIPESSLYEPPSDGISLLDVKNELLLSYLQNLVFLILLKLRERKSSSDDESEDLDNAVVKKVVELRVYIEKGVRPLETRLKYQIDKVLRASDDAARAAAAKTGDSTTKITTSKDERESDESDQSDDDDDDEADGGVSLKPSDIDELQYRPNPSALVLPTDQAGDAHDDRDTNDGIYRPPRITATSMPTTTAHERKSKQSAKSATIDEFIADELSVAPIAEPSIGSNVIEGGRRSKSEKEKRLDEERREFEENNYKRLPDISKKERSKLKTRKDVAFGGEDFRGFDEDTERIGRLTARKGDSSSRSILEKSRKRPVEDGPRGSGSGAVVGERFQKRIKTMDRPRGVRKRGGK